MTQVRPSTTAEKDLLAALRRLEAGKPTHPELVTKHLQGTLKINPSSVSLEAGRSRTLIGSNNCALPEVRQKVLTAKGTTAQGQLLRSQLSEIRKRMAKREAEIRIKDSVMAAQMSRIEQLEEQLASYGAGSSGKVIPIRSRRPK